MEKRLNLALILLVGLIMTQNVYAAVEGGDGSTCQAPQKRNTDSSSGFGPASRSGFTCTESRAAMALLKAPSETSV